MYYRYIYKYYCGEKRGGIMVWRGYSKEENLLDWSKRILLGVFMNYLSYWGFGLVGLWNGYNI